MNEVLTAKMIEWVNEQRRCPCCLTGEFLEGPHGGASINVRCNSCGHEYCFVFFGNVVVMADKLDRNQKELYPGPLAWPMPKEELIKAAEEGAPDWAKPGVGLGVSERGTIEILVRGPLALSEEKTIDITEILKHGPAPGAPLDGMIKAAARLLTDLVYLRDKASAKRN